MRGEQSGLLTPNFGHVAASHLLRLSAINSHGPFSITSSARPMLPRCGSSINETGAGRFFERSRQGPIFLAVGPANRSYPAQMILRLIAVALLNLPQTVILPRQHMVRIGFAKAQRAARPGSTVAPS